MSNTIGHDNSQGWIMSPRREERAAKRAARQAAHREAWADAACAADDAADAAWADAEAADAAWARWEAERNAWEEAQEREAAELLLTLANAWDGNPREA